MIDSVYSLKMKNSFEGEIEINSPRQRGGHIKIISSKVILVDVSKTLSEIIPNDIFNANYTQTFSRVVYDNNPGTSSIHHSLQCLPNGTP